MGKICAFRPFCFGFRCARDVILSGVAFVRLLLFARFVFFCRFAFVRESLIFSLDRTNESALCARFAPQARFSSSSIENRASGFRFS
jgi:hypothetical protein